MSDWGELLRTTLVAGGIYTVLTGLMKRTKVCAQWRAGLVFSGVFAVMQVLFHLIELQLGSDAMNVFLGVGMVLFFAVLALLALRREKVEKDG